MPKETHLELKVGGFILLAVTALTVFVFAVGDVDVFHRALRMRVLFNFANGLKKAAPVRIAGVEAGVVERVGLFFDPQVGRTRVEVIFRVARGTRIPVDSRILVNQLGMLGEKYLEILPGLDRHRFFGENDILIGEDPVLQEGMTRRIMKVVDQVETGIRGLNEIIADKGNQAALHDALAHIDAFSAGLDRLVNGGGAQGSIPVLVGRLDRISRDIETVSGRLASGEGLIGRLLTDDRIYDDLEGLAADLRANPWKLLYRPRRR